MDDILDGVYLPANEIASVAVSSEELVVKTVDGRVIHTPLSWFSFLTSATEEQRQNFRVMGWTILWEALDEGVSMEPVLLGRPGWTNPASDEVELTKANSV